MNEHVASIFTLGQLLETRALSSPDRLAYSFHSFHSFRGGDQRRTETLTYGRLFERAKNIAAKLSMTRSPDSRILILCPPGLDYIASFLGCQLAGMVAVPAYPPRNIKHMARLEAISADAQAAAALCVSDQLDKLVEWGSDGDVLPFYAVDSLASEIADRWNPVPVDPNALAFLQYTSGTTGAPKGVMVTQQQVLDNLVLFQLLQGFRGDLPLRPDDVMCGWLPPYHDMGLVGTILYPLYAGIPAHLMSPAAFAQRPGRWLELISDYRGTLTVAPNFAWQLCCNEVSDEQAATLDLSSLRSAINGAEPVQARTLQSFSDRFSPQGFDPGAFCPAYGLAEIVLTATGWQSDTGGKVSPEGASSDRSRWQDDLQNQSRFADRNTESEDAGSARPIISCGKPFRGHDLVIADPETFEACPEGRVGEIWLSGASVAAGYWNRPELTREVFQARLKADAGGRDWLRTGDLGAVIDGQLYVLGRRKEMVIVRGQNHYAVDLEIAANESDPLLGHDRTIAFGVASGAGEQLVLVHELSRHSLKRFEPTALARSMRRAVLDGHEIDIACVVFLRPASLPRTTSGKLQRTKARTMFLEGSLSEVARWEAGAGLSVLQDITVVRRLGGLDRSTAIPSAAQVETILGETAGVGAVKALWCLNATDRPVLGVALPQTGPGGTGNATQGQGREWIASLRQKLIEYFPGLDAVDDVLVAVCDHLTESALLECIGSGDGSVGEAPEGVLEEKVAAAFCELLGRNRVYRDTDFLQEDGDSLQAARLVGRLQERTGRDVSLPLVFEAPTVRALGAALSECPEMRPVPLEPVDRSLPIPLSHQQERLWFLDQFNEKAGLAYNEVHAFRFNGRLDRDALEWAVNRLVLRHESLRTCFSVVDGSPVQVIGSLETCGFRFGFEDLTGLDDAALKGRIRELRHAPFDLERGPLFRAHAIRLSADSHVLVIGGHHSVLDGWSLDVLMRELSALYREAAEGRSADLSALPVQYADYAVWQRQVLSGARLDEETAWWRGELSGLAEAIALPFDRPRPAVMDYRGGSVGVGVSASVTEGLKRLARKSGATLFMVLETAFAVLLSRLGAGADVAVGTAVAGRPRSELEDLCGFFVNTVVLRNRIDLERSFSDQLASSRSTVLDAFAHDDVPFEAVVEAVSPERSLRHAPLVQVMVALQNTPDGGETFALGDTVAHPFEGVNRETAQFELSLDLMETAEGLSGSLSYALQLFDEATAARIGSMFERVVAAVAETPETKLCNLALLDNAERRLVTEGFNDTSVSYAQDRTVVELFCDQALRRPKAVAVVDGERELSYRALDEASNRLARYLIARGVGPERVVGVCLDRSVNLLVSLLGIWKAGGAYLPLDPDYPQDRLAFMAEDAGAFLVLTGEAQAERLSAMPDSGAVRRVVLDDADTAGEIAAQSGVSVGDDERLVPLTPAGLAYVIYTSGSSGKPKGVMVGHGGAYHLADYQRQELLTHRPRRIGWFASVGFDACIWELLMGFRTGACLVVVPGPVRSDGTRLSRFLDDQRIDALTLPPVLLQAVVEDQPSSLRTLVTAGESPEIGAAQEAAGLYDYINAYGPTETTVCATFHRVPGNLDGGPVPIGQPIANAQVYVVDGHLNPVPVGVSGELLIGGVQVSRGYLGRSALTAERFIADPFSGTAGARLYRTGDVALWRSDGTLEFLGRIDAQVKVRGMRVEPGEIEAALGEQPGVARAVVVARTEAGEAGDQTELVAYLVPERVAADAGAAGSDPVEVVPLEDVLDLGALRSALRAALPEHMVPGRFIGVSHVPLTPSGKVDRKALPEAVGSVAQSAYEVPVTPTERLVAALYADLLGVDRVGRQDGFFELGGHSLYAVRLVARLQAATGKSVAVRDVFEAPSVVALAGRVDEGAKAYSPLVRFARINAAVAPVTRTIVCFPPGGGLAIPYARQDILAEWELHGDVMGLQTRGYGKDEDCFASYEEMVSCYATEIENGIEGALIFVGWSLGGKVAHDVATRLRKKGARIEGLIILDTTSTHEREEHDPAKDLRQEDDNQQQWDDMLLAFAPDLSAEALEKLDDREKLSRLTEELEQRDLIPAGITDAAGFSERMLRFMLLHGDLLNERPEPGYFDGPALVVRAQNTRAHVDDPFLGWRPFCSSVEAADVAHDHQMLLAGEAAGDVARLVADWIARRPGKETRNE